ncbi:hypothetical protein MKX03_007902 [Papaver bracteatum]|nr:hypothetical protein MKX03_007902 [Papaver bracteatum]
MLVTPPPPPSSSEAQVSAIGETTEASPEVRTTGSKVGLLENMATSTPLELVTVSAISEMPSMLPLPPSGSETQVTAVGETIEASQDENGQGYKKNEPRKGTTILSAKYNFGMLVAVDSWSFNLDGTKCVTINPDGKKEDEVAEKIFHLGNDLPYILYAFSGHDFLGMRIRADFIRMMEDKHKIGTVLTSKECSKYTYKFLNRNRKRFVKDLNPNIDPNSLTCGVTVAMYQPIMQKKKLKLKKLKKKKQQKVEEKVEDNGKKQKVKKSKKRRQPEVEEDDEDDEKELKLMKKKQVEEDDNAVKELKLKKRKKTKERKEKVVEEEVEDYEKELKLKKRKKHEDDENELQFKKRKKSLKTKEPKVEEDDKKELKLQKWKKRTQEEVKVEDEDDEKELKLKKMKKKKEKQTQFNPRLYFSSTEFTANRRAGLYYSCKEEKHKIKKFYADGYGDIDAMEYLHDAHDPSDDIDVAVTKLEEAMTKACGDGRSGGIITIDCINCNNEITTVSKKDITKLRSEKICRDLVAYNANKTKAPETVAPYDIWGPAPAV